MASPCQEGIRTRIERLCRIAVRLARGGKSDLGRAFAKFDATEVSLHGLATHVVALEASFTSSSLVPAPMRQCPSSAPPVPGSLASAADWDSTQSEPFDLKIRANRIKWDYSPVFVPFRIWPTNGSVKPFTTLIR